MAERLANFGYLGLVKEAVKGTPLTPTDYAPYYKESFSTSWNLVEDNPIAGNKFVRYQVLPGMRDHKGSFEVMAEPNTCAKFFDMLTTKGVTTGAGPYTQPFTLSATANPNSYTVDLSSGNIVFRFFGVEASKITPGWDKDEMRLNVSASALGSFMGRALAGVPTGAGPYTVNLDTTYDPSPTTGLVVGDLIRFYHNGSATIDATVATIVNSTTFTTTANVSTLVAGDFVYLRPATPAYTNLTPFLWGKTEFHFGANATAALAATQTRVENGSNWEIVHMFESDNGAPRSGSFDPAALVRTQGDAMLKVKKFFDTPDDVAQFLSISKNSCVIRHFSGATNQYELRVTLNDMRIKKGTDPQTDSGKILYADIDYAPVYSQSDGQAFDIKVINNLATI
jgi:hypothetical protein